MVDRSADNKTSVAIALSGLDLSPRKFHALVGREKPAGQHHMRYTPDDLRVARYKSAGVDPDVFYTAIPHRQTPPVIVTRMTKGGVGKTSISVNVGCALAMMGYRVLLIDADPQATATNLLGVESSFETVKHVGDFLTRKTATPDKDLAEAIIPIYAGGFLSLLPADITLAESDASLVTALASHERAHNFLTRNSAFLTASYDVVIVDTAPGTTPVGLAFTYAAKATGKVLTVVEPEGSCLRALDSLMSNLSEIAAVTGVKIGLEVVVNRYHPQLKHVRENMGHLYARFGNMLNENIIPSSSSFGRQLDPVTRKNTPLIESEAVSPGAAAIIDLAKSIAVSFNLTQPGLPLREGEAAR